MTSYNDFMFKIIHQILKEEKLQSITVVENSPSIRNINENLVSQIITEKYMNSNYLQLLQSVFNLSFLFTKSYIFLFISFICFFILFALFCFF